MFTRQEVTTSGSKRRPPRIAHPLALTLIVCTLPDFAQAQGWDITPSIGIAEFWSSNILLAAEGAEEEEYITSIEPRIELDHVGERWDFDLAYAQQILFYREDDGRDQSHGTARMNTRFDLVRERLFLDVRSGLSRQIIDPQSPVGFNNINLSNNVTDTVDYTAGPRWVQPLGRVAEMSMTYEKSVVDFDDPGVFDYQSDRYNLTLGSTDELRSARYGWGVEFDKDKLTHDDGFVTEFALAALNLTRDLSLNSQIFVRAGAESDFRKNLSDAKLDSEFWEFGIRASPSVGNELEVRVGRRFFGRVYGLNWLRRARFLELNVDYVEEPANFAARFGGRQLGLTDLERLSDGTLPGITSDVYISRRLDGRLILTGRRASYTVGLTRERREYESETEEVTSASARFDLNLGSSTVFAVDARRLENTDRAGNKQRRSLWSIEFAKVLSQRLSLFAGATFQERVAQAGAVGRDDYDETQIFVGLRFNRTDGGAAGP